MTSETVQIDPGDAAGFRSWLVGNHAVAGGVWVVLWKRSTGHPSITLSDAVDQALCFGWVDSKGESIDDQRWRLYLSRRKPGSGWSKVNKDKVARLAAGGQMARPGAEVIERARTDGSWALLDGPESGLVPDDLAVALDRSDLRGAYDGLPPSAQKAILTSLALAKGEATRARRIDRALAELGTG
ncbi:MAG: YdeI/OmpD-associated family protein [Chloroflexi bacterium]|nr:YdeI/OmpD-associated family protein [Chloroflexota bacterium]